MYFPDPFQFLLLFQDFSLYRCHQEIVILGKKSFSQVPAKLKEQVRELLIDAGCEDLIEE